MFVVNFTDAPETFAAALIAPSDETAAAASPVFLEQAFEIRLELRPVLTQLGEPRCVLERLREAARMAGSDPAELLAAVIGAYFDELDDQRRRSFVLYGDPIFSLLS